MEGRRIRRKGVVGAVLIGLLAASFVATEASGAIQVVTFDDLAPNTTVSNQYQATHGVSFAGPPSDGAFPIIRAVAGGIAHSGGQVADLSNCPGCEFYTPRSVGRLTSSATQVSAFVGFLAATGASQAQVTLIARDAGGATVGTSSATVTNGQPFTQQVSVTAPTATIASFEFIADPPFGSQPIAIDDLSVTTPDVGPPPDFTLAVANTVVPAAPVVDVPLTLTRLNGSDGDIALGASGLPPGTSASFLPNPVPGTTGAATLRLTANPGAPPSGDTTITITGVPSPGAGSEPRTATLTIRTVFACDGSGIAVGTGGPDRRVFSAQELVEVLRTEQPGRIIVPSWAEWEMVDCDGNPYRNIPIGSGVELIGEPGDLGRRPLLYTNADVVNNEPLFDTAGDDVLVEGLHLRGPFRARDAHQGDEVPAGAQGIRVLRDPSLTQGPIVITDNEIEWFASAVGVRGTFEVETLEEYDAAYEAIYGPCPAYPCPHPDVDDAGDVLIINNYLHNHARVGAGYGVVVAGTAYATIVGNVFENNQHSVAARGWAYSGYLAYRNFILKYVLDEKDHHFDVHGTLSDNHAGGPAGTYFDIAFNTIRGEQTYKLGLETRAAFGLRGRPSEGALFRRNVMVHDDFGEAMKFGCGGDRELCPLIILPTTPPISERFNLTYAGNKHDADFSTEIAAGDFDGDGRTDVFVANGTGWFFSPAGIRPWEYLNASTQRTKDLAFADVDNDGMTDVISRSAGGDLDYLKRGTAAPVDLPSSPVPIQALRFGDFDGDGLTDIFYTQDRRWHVWYGGTHAWSEVGGSVTKLSEMLFGDFDDVAGTDVVAVRNNQWSYSSGAVDTWERLNSKRANSFANAVAADFDGKGGTDIAFSSGQKWRYSVDGRGPLVTLRDGNFAPIYPPLKRLLVGPFDGGTKAKVLSWKMVPTLSGFLPEWRFVLWRGLGTPQAFVMRSEQNMR